MPDKLLRARPGQLGGGLRGAALLTMPHTPCLLGARGAILPRCSVCPILPPPHTSLSGLKTMCSSTTTNADYTAAIAIQNVSPAFLTSVLPTRFPPLPGSHVSYGSLLVLGVHTMQELSDDESHPTSGCTFYQMAFCSRSRYCKLSQRASSCGLQSGRCKSTCMSSMKTGIMFCATFRTVPFQ
jgi:hypothetical protein